MHTPVGKAASDQLHTSGSLVSNDGETCSSPKGTYVQRKAPVRVLKGMSQTPNETAL